MEGILSGKVYFRYLNFVTMVMKKFMKLMTQRKRLGNHTRKRGSSRQAVVKNSRKHVKKEFYQEEGNRIEKMKKQTMALLCEIIFIMKE